MWHTVLSVLLAALFLATGAGKVLGLERNNRNRDRLGVPPWFWRLTGLLEWAGAAGMIVGIWVPVLGVLAASGLAVLMVGAVIARIRAGGRNGWSRRAVLLIAADVVVLVIVVMTAVLIGRGV
jgi:hypothetical protein